MSNTSINAIARFTANGSTEPFRLDGGSVAVYGRVAGTGSVAAGVELFVTNTPDDANSWVSEGTLTLSGTTAAKSVSEMSTAMAFGKLVVTGLTGTLDVSVSSAEGAAAGGGGGGTGLTDTQLRATPVAIGGSVAHDAVDSGNPTKIGGKATSGTPAQVANGDRVETWHDLRGRVNVHLSDPDTNTPLAFAGSGVDNFGTSNFGLAVLSMRASFDNGANAWRRVRMATAFARLITSAATTNAVNVINTMVMVKQILFSNDSASDRWLKVYDKFGSVAVGTDTPKLTIKLPAGVKNGNILIAGGEGALMVNGLGYAITANAADSDTTAIASGDITGLNIIYG